MNLRKIILPVALALPVVAWGAGPKVKVDGYLNLSSAYIWRGEQVCNVHVNPGVAVTFAGLRLENYNYLSLDGGYKEIDWDLSYTLGDFSLHVADYYSCSPASGAAEDFFSWKKERPGTSMSSHWCIPALLFPWISNGLPFSGGAGFRSPTDVQAITPSLHSWNWGHMYRPEKGARPRLLWASACSKVCTLSIKNLLCRCTLPLHILM